MPASKTTYNLTDDIGKVRLYAQDTNVNNPVFTDEEWQIFINASVGDNLRLAAAWGLHTISVDYAKLERWRDAGVDIDAAVTAAVDLADWLEEQAAASDGVSGTSVIAGVPWMAAHSKSAKEVYTDDSDLEQPMFTRDLHRNLTDQNSDDTDD